MFFSDSNIEISLKIGQYLMKLRRTKQNVPNFVGPPVVQIERFAVLFTSLLFTPYHQSYRLMQSTPCREQKRNHTACFLNFIKTCRLLMHAMPLRTDFR